MSSVKHNPLAECWSTAQEQREREKETQSRTKSYEHTHAHTYMRVLAHTLALCGSTHLRTCSCCSAEMNGTTPKHRWGGGNDERNALHCSPCFSRRLQVFFVSLPASSPQSFFLLNPSQIKANSGTGEWMDEKTLRVRAPFSLWQAAQKTRRDVAVAPSSICPQLRLRADSTHTRTHTSSLALSLSHLLSPSLSQQRCTSEMEGE